MERDFKISFKSLWFSIRQNLKYTILNKILQTGNKSCSGNTETYIPLTCATNFQKDAMAFHNSEQEISEEIDYITYLFDSRKKCVDSVTSDESSVSKAVARLRKRAQLSTKSAGLKKLPKHNGFVQEYAVLHPSPRAPCNRQKAAKKWSKSDYKRAKGEIYSGITYFYDSSLIVWSLLDIRCGFVDALLKQFGNIVSVHDRWIRDDFFISEEEWGGVVAVYANWIMAKKAVKEIPKQYEYLKTLELSKLIHCLVRSELQFSLEERTVMTVLAKGSCSLDGLKELEILLLMFGQVISYDSFHPIEGVATVFEVTYACATHAFLAAIVIDGKPFGSSLLEVEIKETAKERAILEDLPFQLQKYIGCTYFPFKGFH